MAQQTTKSIWNLKTYRDNAQPWDDFIVKTDNSSSVDDEVK